MNSDSMNFSIPNELDLNLYTVELFEVFISSNIFVHHIKNYICDIL